MNLKPRLKNERGTAMLVANSIMRLADTGIFLLATALTSVLL